MEAPLPERAGDGLVGAAPALYRLAPGAGEPVQRCDEPMKLFCHLLGCDSGCVLPRLGELSPLPSASWRGFEAGVGFGGCCDSNPLVAVVSVA